MDGTFHPTMFTLDLPVFSMLDHAPFLIYLPMVYTYMAFRKYKKFRFQLKTVGKELST